LRNQPTLTKQTAAADLMMTNATNDNISDDVVDAAEAGEGNLEILVVSSSGINIPTRVDPLGGARFSVSFSPRTPEPHSVQVTFNDEPVPGSPFECPVTSHEYHAHVSSNMYGHVPHISHSHVSHVSHIPAPPPQPSSPLINQKSESRHHQSHRMTKTLQHSRHYVQGSSRY